MASSIGFRPTPEDERILAAATREGESTTDVIRRALRLLEREQWLTQAHADAQDLTAEDLTSEDAAW
jgi:Arc/MetJ-type ribon-helix-helix transcriptional regulator